MFRELSELENWAKAKVAEIEATGWRRHGLKVGDKVRFHCPSDYEDDELWEEILGVERPIEMKIEHGTIGEITQLLSGDRVRVRLTCIVGYWDDEDNWNSFDDDDQELTGEIVTKEDIKHFSSWEWGFLAIEKPKPKPQMKPMF